MKVNLIIDGNYILCKMVFTLHKYNILYGELMIALENAITNYRNIYPFSRIYLVSDSKEKSWRKELLTEYKGKRKKDVKIDWEFVYNTYDEFKARTKARNITTLEIPRVEGDDWISFLVEKGNNDGFSNIIISNDYDIKQLIKYSLNPDYINIMINEVYSKEKVFLPKNYQIIFDKIRKNPPTLFDMNYNLEFLSLMTNYLNNCDVRVIDNVESLMIKVISGDASDNILSAYSVVKNGKRRGIGEKGAQTIYDKYVDEFGEVLMDDESLLDNMVDLIVESKKLQKYDIPDVKQNMVKNLKLVDLSLSNIPPELLVKMNNLYDELCK